MPFDFTGRIFQRPRGGGEKVSETRANCLFIFISMLLLTVCFFLGFRIGIKNERDYEKHANVGRWKIDEKTGESTFVYGVKP